MTSDWLFTLGAVACVASLILSNTATTAMMLPIGLGLLTFVPESIVVWLIVRSDVDAGRFLLHAGTTWLLVWLVANGPMRVVLIRWRFRGGRIVGARW